VINSLIIFNYSSINVKNSNSIVYSSPLAFITSAYLLQSSMLSPRMPRICFSSMALFLLPTGKSPF